MDMIPARFQCLAVAPPGLEGLVAIEAGALGLDAGPPVPGGVPFDADAAGVRQANLHLKIASRVLIRLGRFKARGFPELERKAAALEWDGFLPTGGVGPVRFDVTSRKSRLYHTGAVAERLEKLVHNPTRAAPVGADPHATGPGSAPPGTRFVVRILRDVVEISADSSGEHLHKRGYREHVTRAPLRETLAAAMLAVAWDPTTPLVDPFCGSGTVPIEAARWSLGIPPGSDRQFACKDWPAFRAAFAGPVPTVRGAGKVPLILGSDRDQGAIQAATANAVRGGVQGQVQWACASVSELEPPPGQAGSVITNPPYGQRVGNKSELRNLYARFGQVLKARFSGWTVAVLSAEATLSSQLELPLETALQFENGGIPVELLVGRVP